MKTLSIRQPWAWLIANGYKSIENRDWPTQFRGEFLIHASKTLTRGDYEDAKDFISHIDVMIPTPNFEKLERGGIIGEAKIVDCVSQSFSPWFVGKYGFVLENQRPWGFIPCKGALGFFNSTI